MIYPLVTGFHWADFDFQWYIEGCRSRPGPAKTASGFHSVETFINQPVHPGTNNITIPAYVAGSDRGKDSAGHHAAAGRGPDRRAGEPRAQIIAESHASAPLPTNREFQRHADRRADDVVPGQVLRGKIRGATELALFRETRCASISSKAVEYLAPRGGVELYSDRARARYRSPLWTNRVGSSTGKSSPPKSPATSTSLLSRSRRVDHASIARDRQWPSSALCAMILPSTVEHRDDRGVTELPVGNCRYWMSALRRFAARQRHPRAPASSVCVDVTIIGHLAQRHGGVAPGIEGHEQHAQLLTLAARRPCARPRAACR